MCGFGERLIFIIWTQHQLDSVIHSLCNILWSSDLKRLYIRSPQKLSSGDAVSPHRGRAEQCVCLSRVCRACCLLDCLVGGFNSPHILQADVGNNRWLRRDGQSETSCCLVSHFLLKSSSWNVTVEPEGINKPLWPHSLREDFLLHSPVELCSVTVFCI